MTRGGHRNNRRQHNVGAITSNCGELRIRGSVQAVIEKYTTLAAEAIDTAEREMYLQHAEHYTRVQNERSQHVAG